MKRAATLMVVMIFVVAVVVLVSRPRQPVPPPGNIAPSEPARSEPATARAPVPNTAEKIPVPLPNTAERILLPVPNTAEKITVRVYTGQSIR